MVVIAQHPMEFYVSENSGEFAVLFMGHRMFVEL